MSAPVNRSPNPASPSGAIIDGPLVVWAADGMARIWREQEVGRGHLVSIAAARNEYEPFQIVVSARGGDLTGVNVRISDLIGPAGTINRLNITLYREHYVQVEHPSRFSPSPPGWYPDALIPFSEHPASIFAGAPFQLADGFNQPIWLDLYVSPGAAAGKYTGVVTITADHGLQVTVPVELDVWKFMLPQQPTQRSAFGVIRLHLDKLYGPALGENPTRKLAIARGYYQELIRHRLAPMILDDVIIPPDPQTGAVDLETSPAPGVTETAAQNLHYYMDQQRMATVGLPIFPDWPFPQALTAQRAQAKQYLAAWGTFFAERGWHGRLYTYLLDEPDTAEAYQRIRDWSALVHEVNVEYRTSIKFLATEQPAPQEEAWGDLYGSVDIWVPCCDHVWQDLEYSDGQRTIAQRQALGEEIWWYTAMVQPSTAWLNVNNNPLVLEKNYAPIWLLDYPPANFRVPSWLNQLSGFTGLLYWDTVYTGRSADIWTDPANLVVERSLPRVGADYYLSDGLLFYPGHVNTIGFDGPIPTMRLKWIREGMDDYDYIALLSSIGHREFALEQVRTVARSWGDWDQEPAAFYAARQRLGEQLNSLADQLVEEPFSRVWMPVVMHAQKP